MNEFPENALEIANERIVGFNKLMGLRFVKATSTEIITEMEIQDFHHQAYGIVHGGVYAAMIEATCSNGAAMTVLAEGKSVVGVENSTSFLRGVRSGILHCVAVPSFTGRRTHVWDGRVYNGNNQLAAVGHVRLLVLEPGSRVDGATVGFDSPKS
jgi:1,4-dihydroxy-2-naphthoyl-CoA hydrolase